MAIKAVFFDLDGTLLYTLQDLANSFNHVLENHNFPTHSLDKYREFIGYGVRALVEKALPENVGSDPEQFKAILAEYAKVYGNVGKPTTEPYDGIMDLLKELQKREYKLAIITNKPHDRALEVVDKFFPDTFSHIIGQKAGVPVKPDPTLTVPLLDELGLQPQEVLYIGDSEVDMQLSYNANFTSIGVSWGYEDVPELEAAGAKIIINHPLEVLDHL